MKTMASQFSGLAKWFRKRMEGEMLLQWSIYIILFAVLVVFTTGRSNEMVSWRFYGTELCLAMLLVLNILWQRWEQSGGKQDRYATFRHWVFLLTSSALLAAAVWMGELYNAIFLLFMLCAQAAIILGVWPAGLIFCLINMAVWLAVFRALGADNNSTVSFALSLAIGILFILFLATLLQRYSEQTRRAERLLKELEAANAHLEAAREKEKELAIAEERMRLARDIHDGLGHHLTVLSIQLQAADKLVERNPQAAAEAIRQSRAEARAALEEVRRSVGMMRQLPAESQPLQVMLSNLVRGFAEGTGLDSRFEHSGEPAELSPFAAQTLFRTVQESLTNVQKHGQGVRNILVRLEYTAEAVRLTVSDDGRMPDAASTGQAGYGLKGLQERIDQLGGEFCCGPGSSGGFKVDVCIPLQEVARDPGPAG
jgi:signal transduction histidine kinase